LKKEGTLPTTESASSFIHIAAAAGQDPGQAEKESEDG